MEIRHIQICLYNRNSTVNHWFSSVAMLNYPNITIKTSDISHEQWCSNSNNWDINWYSPSKMGSPFMLGVILAFVLKQSWDHCWISGTQVGDNPICSEGCEGWVSMFGYPSHAGTCRTECRQQISRIQYNGSARSAKTLNAWQKIYRVLPSSGWEEYYGYLTRPDVYVIMLIF
jgi:hypothetical protein